MGILNPLVRDDIDMFASEMLREEDPDPMDMFSRLVMGVHSTASGSSSALDFSDPDVV
jgi:hypothetical protein